MHNDKLIKVEVRYVAAVKPFEKQEKPTETVGQLKTEVLSFLGLSEGGGKTYKLFHDGTELQNMAETLGQVAGDKEHLKLKLEEIVTQG